MGLGRGAQAPQFCGHPKFFCKGNNLFVFANFRKVGKFAANPNPRSRKYCVVRLYHAGKVFTQSLQGSNIRSVLSKTILFKGQ